MISIFTMPKAFTGEFKTIQLNAIKTWKEECPNSEILLAANEEGVSEVAEKYKIRLIHGIQENEFGSPFLNSLFQRATEEAHSEVMAFINTDCMLIGNLEKTVKIIRKKFKEFLLVGVRYDSEISEDLPDSNWQKFVLEHKGLLHPLALKKAGKKFFGGTDLFVFPKSLYPVVPPFNIGTLSYDAWLIYDAWHRRIPIINITLDIITVHQKHAIKTHSDNFWKEVAINKKFCPIKKDVRDADFILENGILRQGEMPL